jgi:6-phosphogluconate dehydrogenase (decarboxylating)
MIGLGRMGTNITERLARFASRQDSSFSAKVIAALGNEFGGHAVKKE